MRRLQYHIHKATIRFPLSEPVPVKLIGRIAKLRANEVAEREKGEVGTRRRSARPAIRRQPGSSKAVSKTASRLHLKSLLAKQADIEIVGEAADGMAGLELIAPAGS